jgi:hypothetical protein
VSALAIYFSFLLVFETSPARWPGGIALVRGIRGFATWVVARGRRQAERGQANGYSVTSLAIARHKERQLLVAGVAMDAVLVAGVVLTCERHGLRRRAPHGFVVETRCSTFGSARKPRWLAVAGLCRVAERAVHAIGPVGVRRRLVC